MRRVVLTDLDDTWFQSRRKCGSEEAEGLAAAAHVASGEWHSFTTPAQRAWLELLGSGATLIPVTARSRAGLSRLHPSIAGSFTAGAVVHHGGLVLDASGNIDESWRPILDDEIRPWTPALIALGEALTARRDALGLPVRVKVHAEDGIAFYVGLRAEAHDLPRAAFDLMVSRLTDGLLPTALWRHQTGTNAAFLPPSVTKTRAAAWLLSRLRAEAGPLTTLGIGDAESDAGFMNLCDLVMLPSRGDLRERFAPPPTTGSFSGSYEPADVRFVIRRLPRLAVNMTGTAEKEALIQSGARHYSEMLSEELTPTAEYLATFEAAVARNGARLARDLAGLADALTARHPHGIQLVSLLRAGTPFGVVLARLLRARGHVVDHASLSVIRDRGLDLVALKAVLLSSVAPPGTIVFVDGWTGKGVIARELHRSLDAAPFRVRGELAVVADLCGAADLAATEDDYLIPSCLLNATVSGLVSRSILPRGEDGAMHGCLVYDELTSADVSRPFVDNLTRLALEVPRRQVTTRPRQDSTRQNERRDALAALMREHGVSDPNRVKPGIGEATRVLLRRVPKALVVRDGRDPDVTHALLLCEQRNVPVVVRPELPFSAVAVIADAADATERLEAQ